MSAAPAMSPADVRTLLDVVRHRRHRAGQPYRNAVRDYLLLRLIAETGMPLAEALQLTRERLQKMLAADAWDGLRAPSRTLVGALDTFAWGADSPTDPLFAFGEQTARQTFRFYRDAAGLDEHYTLESLRGHAIACLWRESRADLARVATALRASARRAGDYVARLQQYTAQLEARASA